MLVWTGYGLLGYVFIIVPAIVVRTKCGEDAIFSPLWFAAITLAAVIPCHFLGRYLNRNAPPKIFDAPRMERNPATGEIEQHVPSGHTVAFIRLEYAGWLVLVPLLIFWLKRTGLFD